MKQNRIVKQIMGLDDIIATGFPYSKTYVKRTFTRETIGRSANKGKIFGHI